MGVLSFYSKTKKLESFNFQDPVFLEIPREKQQKKNNEKEREY